MKKVTSIFSLIAIIGCIAVVVSSCGKKDPNSPGVEYMPDMYRSPSLESNMTYVDMNTGDTLLANRKPVAGTIARGYMPYMYANNAEGYAAAGESLHNPFAKNEANLKEGEELYSKFCVHCHGASGAGDGLVGGKLPGAPPAYTSPAIKSLPEGKIFHSITYGKGLMGAHASQLTQEERWKLVMYVQKLQGPADGATATASDSIATVAVTVPAAAPAEEAPANPAKVAQ